MIKFIIPAVIVFLIVLFWEKIHEFFNKEWSGVVRAKGFFWLVTRPNFVGEVSQAGAFVRHQGIGKWWAAVNDEQWPDDKSFRININKIWAKGYGDRRQEIVFIGLKNCLLYTSPSPRD